jgi:lipopolysaccharide heptosyltransferase II
VRILLVRLRQIGDVVFTTPAVRALRTRFPESSISYLVEPAAAPVVAHNPNIDEVIVAPLGSGVAGWVADVALMRRLRAQKYDIAVDFHGGPRASLLTWLSGAPTRIGYEITGRSWMYTCRVARPRSLRARHAVENQWDLLAPLEIGPPDRLGCPLEMAVDSQTVTATRNRLEGFGVQSSDVLIVMHVSAGNPFRRWPVASFARVASTLVAHDTRRRVVVTSGPSETTAAAQVIAEARSQLSIADRSRVLVCGEFSLAELRALVERAALYIGGDSGPMHVAATSRVPIVGLYGPTLPARSAPWRADASLAEAVEILDLPCRPCDQRTCQPGDFRCLTSIHPHHVIDAAERALAHARD